MNTFLDTNISIGIGPLFNHELFFSLYCVYLIYLTFIKTPEHLKNDKSKKKKQKELEELGDANFCFMYLRLS